MSHTVTIQTFVYNSNSVEVYEEPMPKIKKIPNHAVKFEAGEENRIIKQEI